jgi:hypothetical protein
MAAKSRKEAFEAPATFEARGVAAPFADRRLRQLRVRALSQTTPHDWEAVVGDGPKPTRLPWQKLTGLFKFAPRDMALYFAISARGEKGLDPLVMRDLAAEVDRDHGADDAARLRHADLAAIVETERARVRDALGLAAEKAGCPDVDLGPLATAFAKLGVPIPGAVGFPEDGELGAAAARLDRFVGEIRAYERQASAEAAQRALLVAFAASQFRALLRKDYAKLAGLVGDLRQCVIAGEAVIEILARATSRVAFALDGWAPCLDIWDEAKARDAEAAQDAVDFVLKTMPSLPREEAGGAEAAACWDGIDRQRLALDRPMVDWIDAKGRPA